MRLEHSSFHYWHCTNKNPHGIPVSSAGKSYHQDAKYMIQYAKDAQDRAKNAQQDNERSASAPP